MAESFSHKRISRSIVKQSLLSCLEISSASASAHFTSLQFTLPAHSSGFTLRKFRQLFRYGALGFVIYFLKLFNKKRKNEKTKKVFTQAIPILFHQLQSEPSNGDQLSLRLRIQSDSGFAATLQVNSRISIIGLKLFSFSVS